MVERVLPKHDVGGLFALRSVEVEHLAASVCPSCDSILVPGLVLEILQRMVFEMMLNATHPLGGCEVRFLRKATRLTQQELAERIGVQRGAVARWESEDVDDITGPASIAVRTIIRAAENSPAIEAAPVDNFRHAPSTRPARLVLEAPPISATT